MEFYYLALLIFNLMLVAISRNKNSLILASLAAFMSSVGIAIEITY